MKDKMETLFDNIKSLCDSDLDRIIRFVMGIVSTNEQPKDRPNCPYCGNAQVIKYGHRKGKQRFKCHGSLILYLCMWNKYSACFKRNFF